MLDIVSFLREHREIKIISLDVFDTLLFRTAYNPSDIFGKMYEFEPDVFPEGIVLEDWINARRMAEGAARRKKKTEYGNSEVTLEQIYRELPTVFEDRRKLMDLEIEIEKKCCFLNEPLYGEIQKAAALFGCVIVLCSDMYLDGKTILSILEYNGFNISLIYRIFVSSEWDASKRYEGLFRRLLEECGAEPQEVLHVGDDYYRDVGVAKYLGLHTMQYDLISDAYYRHPFLKLEEISHGIAYGVPCNELCALRLLAAENGRQTSAITEEEQFWYDMGAMIYGPFLTYAVEWALDQAEKQKITTIRPFMREGDFLCRMLLRAAEKRSNSFSIKPLYISRFAIFTSLFEQITAKEVEYFISTYNICVRDVFDNLHIEDQMKPFEALGNKQVNELRNIAMGECSAYVALQEYLTSPQMLGQIRKRNMGKADWMLEYFQKMGLFGSCITLDLGWRGSMQKALDDVFKAHGVENDMRHLLCICSPAVALNAVDGCRIQGYMGTFGKHQKEFFQLSARLFEMVLLSTKGTTVGYEKSGESIEPVVKEIPYPAEQVKAMECVQSGILSFQSVYLRLVKKKPHLKRMGEKPEQLCSLIGRLHGHPLYEEAERLYSLVYDQNFGADMLVPFIAQDKVENYRKMTLEEYYCKYKNIEINWYSGLNALGENRLFYAERQLQMNNRFTMLSVVCLANRVIQMCHGANVVLVQAGEMTKQLLLYLAMAGKIDIVAGIVDNDPRASGTFIGGIPIYPMSYMFENPLYVFATIREECYLSISKQLKNIFGSGISMMGRFD